MSTIYNVNIVGSLANNNGVLSGFSSSNYVSFARPTFNNTFEIGAKITTGNNVSDLQIVYCPDIDQHGVRFEVTGGKFGLLAGANGAWINTSNYTGGSVSPNTTYYLKASFHGSTYKLEVSTDGISYNTVVSYNSSTKVTNGFTNYLLGTFLDHNLGIFGGSIDLNYCYIKIDDNLVWEGVTEVQPITSDYKLIKTTERKYYKYQDSMWTQPLLTANGTMGGNNPAASASSTHGSYDGQPWRAFNGQDTNSTGWADNNLSAPQWIQFYNPTRFVLQSFTIINRSPGNSWKAFKVQASDDGTNFVDIGEYTNSDLVADSSWSKTIDNNSQGMYRYYRFYVTSTDDTVDVKQIKLYGVVRTIIDGTAQDYDYYEDVDAYKAIKDIERKYYKNWAQPVLSSNGTMGGSSFAVEGAAYDGDTTELPAYGCFDNGSKEWWCYSNHNYYEVYNPDPLCITNFQITYSSEFGTFNFALLSCTIKGSNDNSTWTTIKSFSNLTGSAGGTTSLSLSGNSNFYKYYIIDDMVCINPPANTIYGPRISEMVLTATTEGSSSDYDYYEDVDVYKAIIS